MYDCRLTLVSEEQPHISCIKFLFLTLLLPYRKFSITNGSKEDTKSRLTSINNNAHVNKQSSTLDSNWHCGKTSFNNNKNGNVDILSVEKTDSGAGTNNNNFANFDAFSSANFDLFANSEFTQSTETQTIVSKTSTDTTDGLLNSLSFISNPPSKRSTLTNETKQNIKNKNVNECFDTQFTTSFVTNDLSNKKADDSNGNTKSQQYSTFETAFNWNSTGKSVADCDNTKNESEKISNFSNDYSKNDNFDADLEEALKRSLVYQ